MYLSVYAAAKGGINQLTRALAGELGPSGVRVNAIAPGVSESEASEANGYQAGEAMQRVVAATPLGRLGRPADTALVALFLASDAAAWVTGQVIDASGGWNITP
jgi:3-oxoacyl-[acyl-carrier protein] reductase